MEARLPTDCADMAWLAGVDVTVDGDEDVGFLFPWPLPLTVGLLCDLAFFPGAPDTGTPCSQSNLHSLSALRQLEHGGAGRSRASQPRRPWRQASQL
jgi:hypothetical protein